MSFRRSLSLREVRWLALVGAAIVCALGSAANAAEQVRYAVVVGNNQGNTPARSLRYAEQEVTKLSEILRERGDFEGVVVLRGAKRQEIELALRAARGKLEEARAAGKPTLFLFYYSGHGDNEALELGSSRLPLRDLRSFMETLPADVRLAFVDACQSGALTGVKGGRRAPAYEVRLADPGSVRGMAIVTSSTANELSQESDDLQGSFFSHNIMAGLTGLADSSRDGQVTLSELYNYAFRRTLAGTAASLIGGQHPTYDYQMSGAGEVILTRTRPKDAQLAFPRETGATYSVIHRGEVAAELSSSGEQDLYLVLPAGEYRVVRRSLASVTAKGLVLSPGGSVTVNPSEMTVIAAVENQRKKGADLELSASARLESPSQIGAHAGVSTGILGPSEDLFANVGVSYARAFPWLSLRIRGDLGRFSKNFPTTWGATDTSSSSFLRMAPALDALLPVFDGTRVSLLVGPTIGVPIMRQSDSYAGMTLGPGAWSYGFAAGIVSTLAVKVAPDVQLGLTLGAGGEFFKTREADRTGVARKGVLSASLGATVGF